MDKIGRKDIGVSKKRVNIRRKQISGLGIAAVDISRMLRKLL